ncbi:MAG: hypothetical protein KGM24_01960, partial [Elusimicrobia bacterium]|nr:hypothetical protein [Elusimicrobiota bacterium]
LRARVESAARRARVIVVPVLIARGGIEDKLPKALAGLTYAYDAQTLMPHAGFAEWVLERAARTARARPTARLTPARTN